MYYVSKGRAVSSSLCCCNLNPPAKALYSHSTKITEVDSADGIDSERLGILAEDHEDVALQLQRRVLIRGLQAGHKLPLQVWQGVRLLRVLSAHFGVHPSRPHKLHLHCDELVGKSQQAHCTPLCSLCR